LVRLVRKLSPKNLLRVEKGKGTYSAFGALKFGKKRSTKTAISKKPRGEGDLVRIVLLIRKLSPEPLIGNEGYGFDPLRKRSCIGPGFTGCGKTRVLYQGTALAEPYRISTMRTLESA
jgi:hypothetical protein